MSASSPPATALRVVSDPAANRSEKNEYSSTSVSCGGSTSPSVACTTTDNMSSVGWARFSFTRSTAYSRRLDCAATTGDGVYSPSPSRMSNAAVDRLPQRVTVGLGHAEEDADRLHRQLRSHVDEEVERLVDGSGVEEVARSSSELVFQPAHRSGCEPAAHQATNARVSGVVHHVQHHARDVEVLEQRAAALAIPASLGRVGARIVEHLQRLGVGGDAPEPFAPRRVRGGFVPEHRCLAPVDGEQLVRETVGEVVEIGEVDLAECGRAVCHEVGQVVGDEVAAAKNSTGLPSASRSWRASSSSTARRARS